MGPIYYILIALPCTIGAMTVAVLHIYKHLLNYTEPTYQRYIVRIIFMVPVYALMSFLSLVLNKSTIYFNSIREMYEAWVIYNFLSLCLAWVGGPGAVVVSLSGKVLNPNWCLMTCCFPPIPLDGRFIRRCKQGCLQFVILKPILVVVTLILYAKGKYEDGNFNPLQSYLYLTIIYTISYSMALYALALFYVACRDLLEPFNPVPKFIIIKSVVFLTYWQGVLVFLAAKSQLIKGTTVAAEFQNFIICVEMLIAAIGHLYAFPYKEYSGANIGANHGFTASLAHALKLNDFYHDTVHQVIGCRLIYPPRLTASFEMNSCFPTTCILTICIFNFVQFAPTYHDYVLYNPSESEDGARKYRSRTFVPTGLEMDTVRRNKNMYGNKLEDIQLSSLSSSGSRTPENTDAAQDTVKLEAVDSLLLMDDASMPSNAEPVPFDLSLVDIDMSNYPEEVPAANEAETR